MKTKLAVIARYNEDVNWVRGLTIPYIIYNKGSKLDMPCIEIENKGREGDTWLTFILEHYFYIPDITYFIQGDPFYHCPDIIYITAQEEEFRALGETLISDGWGNPHHCGLPIKETYYKIFGEYKIGKHEFAPGGQYVVPKEYILNKSIRWWQRLHSIYSTYNQNPWIFERLWGDIFKHKE